MGYINVTQYSKQLLRQINAHGSATIRGCAELIALHGAASPCPDFEANGLDGHANAMFITVSCYFHSGVIEPVFSSDKEKHLWEAWCAGESCIEGDEMDIFDLIRFKFTEGKDTLYRKGKIEIVGGLDL